VSTVAVPDLRVSQLALAMSMAVAAMAEKMKRMLIAWKCVDRDVM